METYFKGEPFKIVTTEGQFRAALLRGGIIIVKGQITIDEYLHIIMQGTQIWGYQSYDEGMSGVIIDNDDANQHAFFLEADDVTIRDLEISGAQAFPTVSTATSATKGNHNGIAFGRDTGKCQRFKLQRCRIHDLWMGVYAPGGPGVIPSKHVTIDDNYFHTFSHSGIYGDYGFKHWKIINNQFDWRLDGSSYAGHPDNPTTAGDNVHIGNESADIRIDRNTLRNAIRWGAELFFCNDSAAIDNCLEDCTNGISLGGGEGNIADNNQVAGADGGVGAIEMVGKDQTIVNNRISDGGKVCLCGIAINGDNSVLAPNTCGIISGNTISGQQMGMQILSNAGKGTAKHLLIDGNTIDLNTRAGEQATGIFFNDTIGNNKLGKSTVQNNLFRGNSRIDLNAGCIAIGNTLEIFCKRNTQIATLQAGETSAIQNGMIWPDPNSSVYTDDANTLQSGTGINTLTGTNTRIVP